LREILKDFAAGIVRVHGRTADSSPPMPKSVQDLQTFNVRRGIEPDSEGQMSREPYQYDVSSLRWIGISLYAPCVFLYDKCMFVSIY